MGNCIKLIQVIIERSHKFSVGQSLLKKTTHTKQAILYHFVTAIYSLCILFMKLYAKLTKSFNVYLVTYLETRNFLLYHSYPQQRIHMFFKSITIEGALLDLTLFQ